MYAEHRRPQDLTISAARDPPTTLVRPRPSSIPNDPLQRVSCDNWLNSIFPFIGAGAFTLAGRLFWRLTARWEAQVKAELDTQPSRHPSAVSHEAAVVPWPSLQDLMHSSVQRVQRDFDVAAWEGMVDCRLQYSQGRGILSVRDAKSHSGGALRWLTPAQVEERIRFVVGNEVFAVLAQPTLERWEMSGRVLSAMDSSAVATSTGEEGGGEGGGALIDGLLDWAVDHYVCFGNGPRWDLGQFDEGLRAWCLRATARAAPMI